MTAFLPVRSSFMSPRTTRPRKLIGRVLTARQNAQTITDMGERDAFGREIGEDTLQEMGWRADLSGNPAPPPPVKPASVEWSKPRAEPPTQEQPARTAVYAPPGGAPPAPAPTLAAGGTPPLWSPP